MESEIRQLFGEAQRAVAQGNWAGLFALLEPSLAVKIGKNSLVWTLENQSLPELAELQGEYRAWTAQLQASAQRILQAALPEQNQLSLLHRSLLKRGDQLLETALAKQPGELAGRLENLRRQAGGGGSVSSTLFERETLEDIVCTGNQAAAVRRYPGGSSDRIRFVRRRDGWKIRLW